MFSDNLDKRIHVSVLTIILESIYLILEIGEKHYIVNNMNIMQINIENSATILKKIEKLQEHSNSQIYELSFKIIDSYFDCDNNENFID